jgi:hypothetical protein
MSSISMTLTVDDFIKPDDDIVVYRGSYLQIDCTAVESDGSTAIDLTGSTIRFVGYDIEGAANEFVLTMQPITTATWSADVVTFTATAHGYVATDSVTVEDCGNSNYDGTYTVVSAPTADTFTAALVGDPGAFTTDGYVSEGAKITMTAEASGTFSIFLTDTETDVDAKTYLYDIHIVLTGGTEHHAASGKLRVYPSAYTGP